MLSTRAFRYSPRFVFCIIAVGLSVITWTLPAQAQAPQPAPPDIRELKALYQRPPTRPIENRALVELGRLLFWDPAYPPRARPRARLAIFPIWAGRPLMTAVAAIRVDVYHASRSR